MEEVLDVAQITQNVDKNDSDSRRLTPATFQHVKPLSVDSRTVVCDKEPSLHHPRNVSNPFCNLQIEVVINTAKKRKLDEPIDDGYSTPPKQSFSSRTLSPDQRGVMDYCSPTVKLDLMSSPAISLLHKSQPITSEMKNNVSSQEHCDRIQCMSLAGPGGDKGTVTHTLQCKKVILNSHVHLNEPVKIPTESEEINEKSWKKEMEEVECVQEDQNKETSRDKRDEQGMGYFTMAYKKVPEMNPTKSEDPPLHKLEEKTVVGSPSREPAALPLSHQRSETAVPRPDQSEACTKSSTESHRLIICSGEVDPEEEKQYVHLVTMHLNEKAGSQDARTELLNLMTSVADQTTGSDGRQWQHPSDLTRKNYRRLLGNRTRKMALDEWQAKNSPTSKRFANLPKVFERSVLL